MKKKKIKVFTCNIYVALLIRLLIIFALFSLCRVFFYLFNTGLFPGMTFEHFFSLLKGGLKFDLTAILYTNAIFILGYLLPFKFRYNNLYQQILKWIFYITNGIAIALNCIDFIYFRFTLRRSTWSVLNEFSNEKGNFALLGQFLLDYWYVLFTFIAFIVLLVFLYKRIEIRKKPLIENKFFYYSLSTVLMALGVYLFVGGVRGGFKHSTRPITISNAAVYANQPNEIGIVLNTPFSIFRTLRQINYPRFNYFEKEKLDVIYTPIHQPDTSTPFTPKNVVIIIVESMSKEYIGALNKDLDHGNYKGYMPFLDSLITKSYTFNHSFGNGLKSIDGMPSVLTSIPSFPDPYILSVYSNNKIKGIAALLKEKGYDCSFFHGAPNGSMGFDAFAKMSGFEHYYGKNEYGNDADFDGMWSIWDEPFLQFMANVLNQKKEPFLGAVFTASSHHPYKVPKEYEGKFPKGSVPIHQCIGYTDMALRKFFETASAMPWFKNTLFVLVADHTNQTAYEKSSTAIGPFLIPIIYYDPSGGLQPDIENLRATQQIDIMPSILNYLHYDKPYFAFGFDALSKDSTDSKSFVINYNGFYQVYKGNYVLQTKDDNSPFALYEYDSDKLLKNNIIDKYPEIVEELLTYFKAFRQQYNQKLIDNEMVVNQP